MCLQLIVVGACFIIPSTFVAKWLTITLTFPQGKLPEPIIYRYIFIKKETWRESDLVWINSMIDLIQNVLDLNLPPAVHTPVWRPCGGGGGDDDDNDAPRDQIRLSGLERTHTWIFIFKIISPCLLYFPSAVMTNTRRQLIGWCLKQSTAPRWRSSAGPDWACSLTPSSVRTPLLILTSRGSHRAQVLKPGNTCT